MNTAEEGDARTKLLAALHPTRARPKRKYRRGPEAAAGRSAYFVNQETNVSLQRLLFIAGSVLQKLVPQPPAATAEDTLPGITPASLTALENLREPYRAADADQQETDSAKGRPTSTSSRPTPRRTTSESTSNWPPTRPRPTTTRPTRPSVPTSKSHPTAPR